MREQAKQPVTRVVARRRSAVRTVGPHARVSPHSVHWLPLRAAGQVMQ
jgi:hypothetical protein